MNWLAHVFLSEPDGECRLGNLLADRIKGKARQGLPAGVLRGMACHQVIDAFTDFHPLVHRSKRRISDEYGRYAGILVDVFYDHVLARAWPRYADVALETFTAEVYEGLRACASMLPEEAQAALERMAAEDWLGSYRHVEGIEATLRRLSVRVTARLQRPVALEGAIGELTARYNDFAEDFAAFFPELRAHVARWQEG
ncbi:MAG: ACP phosphodiesterase [Gemmataceae bacterium]|nr:ACP phosphodiesterase [Gemmataceae bacterium]